MLGNKYSNFLTILLVIVVVAIVVGLIFLGVRFFRSGESTEDAIKRFEQNVGSVSEEDPEEELEISEIGAPTGNSSSGGGTGYKKQYYEEYVMVGYIEIPKTKVKLPILEKGTDKSLDKSVAVMYPSNPTEKLNKAGNVVIMGHNYRNGKFFSDNKKLATGDKIIITDYTGAKLTYTIYEKYETTPEDTSFITRDTKGAIEITLSTCTDDTARRTIIKAKAN